METISVTFDRYIYKDEESMYAVFRVRDCTKSGVYYICEPDEMIEMSLTKGTVLSLTGHFVDKPTVPRARGEKQFAVSSYMVTDPDNIKLAAGYLAGLGIKGVKDKMAERLAEICGGTPIKFFKNTENVIECIHKEIPLLPLSAIEEIRTAITHGSVPPILFSLLAPSGISQKDSYALFAVVSEHITTALTAENIRLAMHPGLPGETNLYDYASMAGVNFFDADRLAQTMGYTAYNQARVRQLIIETMQASENNGNTYIFLGAIYRQLNELIKKSAFPNVRIALPMIKYVIDKNTDIFREEKGRYFMAYSLHDEKKIAQNITRITNSSKVEPNYNSSLPDEVEKRMKIKLDASQKKCFSFAETTGIKILTGGAGSGKTTVISALMHTYKRMGKKIALCAPTGKAAQRMTEVCSERGLPYKAQTIHKMLDIKPYNGATSYTENEAYPADVIICDEVSMVDSHLFALLVSAVASTATLILVGDSNQLPSVGAGNVLGDLVSSGKIALLSLKVNHRQASLSSIIDNAEKIKNGRHDITTDSSFTVIEYNNEEQMLQAVIGAAEANKNLTVLSPIKAGLFGVTNLNQVLRPILNPTGKLIVCYGDREFHLGDKVLMTRNNYSGGYVNGDTGVIVDGDCHELVVDFGSCLCCVSRHDLCDMSHAYALTVHKAQGSQCSDILIVLPENATNMLYRNLIYTAVTRATETVSIYSYPGALEQGIINNKGARRQTSLADRLLV